MRPRKHASFTTTNGKEDLMGIAEAILAGMKVREYRDRRHSMIEQDQSSAKLLSARAKGLDADLKLKEHQLEQALAHQSRLQQLFGGGQPPGEVPQGPPQSRLQQLFGGGQGAAPAPGAQEPLDLPTALTRSARQTPLSQPAPLAPAAGELEQLRHFAGRYNPQATPQGETPPPPGSALNLPTTFGGSDAAPTEEAPTAPLPRPGTAGTLPTRLNNPLAVKVGPATQYLIDQGIATVGPAAKDGGNFLQFSRPELGFLAADALLQSPVYSTLTLDAALKKWSNKGYGGEVAQTVGLDLQTRVRDLSTDQRATLIQAQARREGYVPQGERDTLAFLARVKPPAGGQTFTASAPPAASAAPTAPTAEPPLQVDTSDLRQIQRLAQAYGLNDRPELAVKLMSYVQQETRLRHGAALAHRYSQSTDPAMQKQGLDALAVFAIQQGQVDAGLKLLTRGMPLSDRELLSGSSATTRDQLHGQLQRGEPLDVGKALAETERRDEPLRRAQASQVVETSQGIYSVDKRTNQATLIAEPAGASAGPGAPGPAPGETRPLRGKLTETQARAFGFGSRALQAHTILNQLESEGEFGTGFENFIEKGGKLAKEIGGTAGTILGVVSGAAVGTAVLPGAGTTAAALVGGGKGAVAGALVGGATTMFADAFANLLRSPAERRYAQARIDFITAILRRESGAAISFGEFINEDKRYFPQVGDDPSTIRQKSQARLLVLQTLSEEAGRPLLVPQVPTATPPAQTPQDAGVVTMPGGETVRLQPSARPAGPQPVLPMTPEQLMHRRGR